MSRLVFLLVYRRKINLFCLLVKRTLKPRPSGEVAPSGDGEGYLHPNYSLNVKISPKTIKTIKKKVI